MRSASISLSSKGSIDDPLRLGLGEELRVLHHGLEGLPVDRHPVGRRSRRGDEGPAELLRQHDQIENLLVVRVLQQIVGQRHIGEIGILLEAHLNEDVHVFVHEPFGADGLVALPGVAAQAFDFAAFHGQYACRRSNSRR